MKENPLNFYHKYNLYFSQELIYPLNYILICKTKCSNLFFNFQLSRINRSQNQSHFHCYNSLVFTPPSWIESGISFTCRIVRVKEYL